MGIFFTHSNSMDTNKTFGIGKCSSPHVFRGVSLKSLMPCMNGQQCFKHWFHHAFEFEWQGILESLSHLKVVILLLDNYSA
jgi:hypothetical protein